MALDKEELERLSSYKAELYLLKRGLRTFKDRTELGDFERSIVNSLIDLIEDKEFNASACGVGYK